ncbi:MAG: hypothetical protein WBX95_21125, partial [Xanthobacteraceae bacterium]
PERRRRASRHAGFGAAAMGGVPARGWVKPKRLTPEYHPLIPAEARIQFLKTWVPAFARTSG